MAIGNPIHRVRSYDRAAGFSLAELMISLVLISVISLAVGLALNQSHQRISSAKAGQNQHQHHMVCLRDMAEEIRWAREIHDLQLDRIRFTVSHALGQNNNTMRVTPGNDFSYSSYYTIWRITHDNGGFTGTFTTASAAPHTLRVIHLASYSTLAPGNGYSPVTIKVNGQTVASDWDPASENGGSHKWVTDTWTLHPKLGDNTFSWKAGNLATHYWIQNIEIIDQTNGSSIFADFTGPVITTSSSTGSGSVETIEYYHNGFEEKIYRIYNDQPAQVFMSQAVMFNIFIDEDGFDGAGNRYLRSLSLEITPRTVEFEPIKKYIHMVNFPFWEK